MPGRSLVVALASGALVILVAACGAAATPIPSAAAPSAAAPSVEAPSAAASVEAPSAAAPSQAAASEAAPSNPIAGFSLPSSAKDLEAILPDQMCGGTSIKTSQTGPEFMANAQNQDFVKLLQGLGKTPSDVAYALAIAGSSGCLAGIFRINGIDSGTLQQAFQAQTQAAGETYTQATVGGKQVLVQTTGTSKSYIYFKGDALLFAAAKSDDQAATILQQLP